MVESFGARLRQRREEQGIALATIAEQTKIKLSLLEALERDDVSHWPSGIFRRAFIRGYAHAVNLNPDVIVQEFLERCPEPTDDIAARSAIAAIASSADSGPTNGGPPTRLRYLVGSAMESLSRHRRGPVVEGPVASEGTSLGLVVRPAPDAPPVSAPPAEAGPVEVTNVEAVVPEPAPVAVSASSEPDLLALAQLCTEFGCVENARELPPLIERAARILGATGVVVWVWDVETEELRPALAHGYSDRVLAGLSTVKRDADNATAGAFRSARTCAITGSHHASGALVEPLLTPGGCVGVLAIELNRGCAPTRSMRAVATIIAAQLSQLLGGASQAQVQSHADQRAPSTDSFMPPILVASGRR